MGEFIYAVAAFVLFFALIYGNYGKLVCTIMKYSKKPVKKRVKGKMVMTYESLTFKESIKGYIPIWQAVVMRKTLYGYAGFTAPMAIVSIVCIVFNLIVSYVLPINPLVMLIAHLCMYLGIIVNVIMYAIVTVDCANMYGFGKICMLLNALVPHLACTWMINNIPHIMADMHKDKTFEENHGETVIKSKHS